MPSANDDGADAGRGPRGVLGRWAPGRRRRRLRAESVSVGEESMIVLDGRLNGATAPLLRRAVEAAGAGRRLVVDLCRLRAIDAAGVEAVRAICAAEAHGEVVLMCRRGRIRRRLAQCQVARQVLASVPEPGA